MKARPLNRSKKQMMLTAMHNRGCLQVRDATDQDTDFLFTLFRLIKTEELAAPHWNPALHAQVLHLQFHAHQHHYRDTRQNILQLAETPIGRLILQPTEEALLLADIALLPDYRAQGIGTALLRQLQSEAAAEQKPLRLSVLPGSRAAHLYQRLDFKNIGKTDTHEQMEWSHR